jgi:flagellar biosynthesis/type III secretory pathway ATPase
MELHLDRRLVNRRLFPAIDINQSGTRKEELLMHPDELSRVWILRKVLSPLSSVDAMQLLSDKLMATKSNKDFLKSLGPQLEGIVREEALNAQRTSEKFAVDDLANMERVWKQNGGEIIRFDAAETTKYLDVVQATLPAVLKANAKMQADYDLLVATASAAK